MASARRASPTTRRPVRAPLGFECADDDLRLALAGTAHLFLDPTSDVVRSVEADEAVAFDPPTLGGYRPGHG
jgi:hypothetical protein